MPLVTSKGMLLTAHNNDFAIGAFNANNLEMAKAIIEAAEKENAPVIVQVSQGGIKHIGEKEIASSIRQLAHNSNIPIALHFDHGTDIAHNIKCLRAGFTSLMFDGSSLSYEDNIEKTKQVVRFAHTVNIPVEAELGKVPKDKSEISKENLNKYLTKPEQAIDFVKQTNVDFLAVAVGSMHKMKNQNVSLDIERIKQIKSKVDVPLVLHGASGVTDDSLKKAITAGISKINIHTYLAKNFTDKVREVLNKNPEIVDLREYLKPGRDKMIEAVINRMRLFNVSNKADISEYVEVKEPDDLELGEIVE